jgi:hypothetical protein
MRGFEPMSLANMRANGVRSVTASCANCGRSADVNVDTLPETLTIPEAGKRLRCSSCGGKTISTRPHTSQRQGVPDYRQSDSQNGLCPRPVSLRRPPQSARRLVGIRLGFRPRINGGHRNYAGLASKFHGLAAAPSSSAARRIIRARPPSVRMMVARKQAELPLAVAAE